MDALSITYLGWSTFRIGLVDGRPLFLDPHARCELPIESPIVVLVSHGHPEHLAGLRAYLERPQGRSGALVLASSGICRHLAGLTEGLGVEFRPVAPGEALQLDEFEVGVFEWAHLPLLPPGIGPGFRHVWQLLSRPGLALRIAKAGLAGPRPGPMLGFRISIGSWQVLAHGEGLHRFCRPEPGTVQPDHMICLAGIEPGDEAAMPHLLSATLAGSVLLFEPHAKWRHAFGMPRVDLADVRRRLEPFGIAGRVAIPGRTEVFSVPQDLIQEARQENGMASTMIDDRTR